MNRKIQITWIVSLLSMTCIIIFQLFWLYNLYQLKKTEYQKDINEIFVTTIEKEMDRYTQEHWGNSLIPAFSVDKDERVVKYRKNGQLKKYQYDGETSFSTVIRNSCYELMNEHTLLDLSMIDSLCKIHMYGSGITDRYVMELIDFKEGKLLATTENTQDKVNRFLTTEKFHLGLECEHAILAHFDFPYRSFFPRMGSLLVVSLLLFLILAFCLVYQIKTILVQKKISEMRENFVFSMVHELRGPLSFISNAVVAFKAYGVETIPESQIQLIEGIKGRGENLSNLLEKLLTVGKQNDHLELERDKLDMSDLLNRLVEQYTVASWKNATVRVENHLEDSGFFVDKVHFNNMINNLVENAIKYSGDNPVVTITCEVVRGALVISVADQGIGIPQVYLDRIFENYYRVPDTRNKRIYGFGIGLSYVRRIAEAHGGTVYVESEVGKGSVFTIRIPLKLIQRH